MHDEIIAQGEVSLRDYLYLLKRRGAIILQTTIAVLIVGIIVALVSRPVYSSSGRLLVEPPNPALMSQAINDPFGGSVNTGMVHNIETQMQVLSSGSVLSEAFRASGVQVGDPRISVSISNDKDIDIINIATEAHTAVAASDVTNNLMDLYISRSKAERTADLREAIKFAEGQLDDANKAWAKAATDLQTFQNRNRVTDLDKAMTSQNDQLTLLQTKEGEAQATLDGILAQKNVLEQQLKATPPTRKVTLTQTNPQVAILDAQLVGLQVEQKALAELYRPDFPKSKELTARIAGVEAALKKTAPMLPTDQIGPNAVITDLTGQVAKLAGDQAQQKAALARIQANKQNVLARIQELGRSQYTQAKLTQARDIAQDSAKQISSRLSDLNIRVNSQSSPVNVLTRATINTVPVRPKRVLIVFLSLVSGLFLGVCFALLQEFLDDRVNSPEEARRLLSVPALGYIPQIEREDQRLLTAQNTGGSVLESYRVLRSNVRFAAIDDPLQTILVTSTMPGEGKSVTAVNLAVAMALDGKRVILVDADLRRPTIHEKFGLRSTPGLTNVLVGAMPVEKALQPTPVENLSILASGPLPPNPAELLNSRAMEQVQESLKEQADVVIFDSPPCLSVADAQVLAATVDGLIYVIQMGSTRKSALRHGNELLRQAHARILGIVYNKVQTDSSRSEYYYGYYSYYHKAELPDKSNGKGERRRRHSEWEELTAQTPSSKAIVQAPESAEKSDAVKLSGKEKE